MVSLPLSLRTAQCVYTVVSYQTPARNFTVPLGLILVSDQNYAQARFAGRLVSHMVADYQRRYVQGWLRACRFHPPTTPEELHYLACSLDNRQSCLRCGKLLRAVGAPALLFSDLYDEEIASDKYRSNLSATYQEWEPA